MKRPLEKHVRSMERPGLTSHAYVPGWHHGLPYSSCMICLPALLLHGASSEVVAFSSRVAGMAALLDCIILSVIALFILDDIFVGGLLAARAA